MYEVVASYSNLHHACVMSTIRRCTQNAKVKAKINSVKCRSNSLLPQEIKLTSKLIVDIVGTYICRFIKPAMPLQTCVHLTICLSGVAVPLVTSVVSLFLSD